jgi:hypothetical protein
VRRKKCALFRVKLDGKCPTREARTPLLLLTILFFLNLALLLDMLYIGFKRIGIIRPNTDFSRGIFRTTQQGSWNVANQPNEYFDI